MKMAHKEDITLNKMIEKILREQIEKIESGKIGKCCPCFNFICPKCGSTNFGTTSENGDWNGILTGHCHGDTHYGRCGFSWLRSNDNILFCGD